MGNETAFDNCPHCGAEPWIDGQVFQCGSFRTFDGKVERTNWYRLASTKRRIEEAKSKAKLDAGFNEDDWWGLDE